MLTIPQQQQCENFCSGCHGPTAASLKRPPVSFFCSPALPLPPPTTTTTTATTCQTIFVSVEPSPTREPQPAAVFTSRVFFLLQPSHVIDHVEGQKEEKKKKPNTVKTARGGNLMNSKMGCFVQMQSILFHLRLPACLLLHCAYTPPPTPTPSPPPPPPHPSQKNSSAGTRYPKVKASILSKVPVGNNTAEKKCKEFNLFPCCLLAHPPPFGSQDVTSSLSPPTLASCLLPLPPPLSVAEPNHGYDMAAAEA